MPFYFMDYWYIILVVPAIIFSLICQAKVNSTYKKYSQVMGRKGITGAQVAQMILDQNNIKDVNIEPVRGTLSDHYDPRAHVIRLSEGVYNSTSVAALGIAAHEAGHTCQHYQGYGAIKLRNAIFPVASIGSSMAVPLVFIGLLFNFSILINIGIIFFAAAVVFQLVTLPVEFNASSRAISALDSSHILEGEELNGTKKVLSAAAMTYVASLAVSLMSLLRLLLITRNRRD